MRYVGGNVTYRGLPVLAGTDSELDEWMESHIYPALADIPGLDSLLTLMVPQGFDYQRDDAMGLWTSADMKYSITYEM